MFVFLRSKMWKSLVWVGFYGGEEEEGLHIIYMGRVKKTIDNHFAVVVHLVKLCEGYGFRVTIEKKDLRL